MSNDSDRKPVADQAEADAWFPSPYSLTQVRVRLYERQTSSSGFYVCFC